LTQEKSDALKTVDSHSKSLDSLKKELKETQDRLKVVLEAHSKATDHVALSQQINLLNA
jgi:hypothetical protein